MPKKNANNVGRRAWNLLRLAIIWARKGALLKPRFLMDLRLLPKFIKSLAHSTPRAHLHYGDHELSFDETPIFHVKMNRPASMRFHFPCITPHVDFEYEFHGNVDVDVDGDGSEICSYDGERRSSGYDGGEERDDDDDDEEEDGIDLRAEKFIAEFYEQMKMQRQISFSQYDHKSL